MSDEDATLTIGQVAEQAGVNASAIRYYERNGVLPEPARSGGQRRYGPETIARLHVIAVARHAGFTLEEITVLLRATDAGTPAHEPLRQLAARKLPDVEALIARARLVRAWLTTATACECETFDVCDLFAEGRGAAIAAPPIVPVAPPR